MSNEQSGNEELAALVASKKKPDATPSSPTGAPEELSWPCLTLRIGERWFGLRADTVREVVVPGVITRIPAQPGHILGVSLVHGRLVPAIDLGSLMTGVEVTLENQIGLRLAVVSHEDAEIGLVADEAQGVIYLPAVAATPQSEDRPKFILGEVRWQHHLVCLLDAARLIQAAIGVAES